MLRDGACGRPGPVAVDQADLYRELTAVVREVLDDDGVVLTPELTAKDVPGWDSFKQIEIILALEDRHGVKFSSRELDGLHSVGDLARTLLAKLPPT